MRIDYNETVVRSTVAEAAYGDVRRVLVAINILARTRASRGPYVTGRLAASVHTDGPEVGTGRVSGRVGSPLPYAASNDQGSERHIIRPMGAGRLNFFWRKVGHRVSSKSVNHPGTKASHFLTEPAEDVCRRNGYVLVIHGNR